MSWLRKLFGLNDKPAPTAPICAETGEPKWPSDCWNVRCQLGGACCRATRGVKESKNG